MKLGDGGEAFFVFETSDEIPEDLQTSPVISPTASPLPPLEDGSSPPLLQEPEYLDLNIEGVNGKGSNASSQPTPRISPSSRTKSDLGECHNSLRH